jgi:hypothetical protein
MTLPAPSLSSAKGVVMLIVAVAVAGAVLSSTGIGRQLQSAVNSVAARVPV